jgi:hypothetical protein
LTAGAWTAVGTIALAAVTFAALAYTIVMTMRERRQSAADRAEAAIRLTQEREAGDRRLREERDHAEGRRRDITSARRHVTSKNRRHKALKVTETPLGIGRDSRALSLIWPPGNSGDAEMLASKDDATVIRGGVRFDLSLVWARFGGKLTMARAVFTRSFSDGRVLLLTGRLAEWPGAGGQRRLLLSPCCGRVSVAPP